MDSDIADNLFYDKFTLFKSFSKTISSNYSSFIPRNTSSPFIVNYWISLLHWPSTLTLFEGTNFFYKFCFWFSSILSFRYFLIWLTPPTLIFWRIAFRGFPSIWRRNSPSMNPISDGKSGRSLLEISKVFKFLNLTISPDIFLILLSLRIKMDKFGHLLKSLNSERRLNDREMVSSF